MLSLVIDDIKMSQVRLQHGRGSFSAFTILAFTILTLFFVQAAGVAFLQLGIPIWLAILIIPGSLLGSVVNIPVYTIKSNPERIKQVNKEVEDWIENKMQQISDPARWHR